MAPPPPPGRPPETSLLAIVSLVAGVLGVFGSFFAPLLASIVAIICGHVARGRIAREPFRLTGSGIALVGLILGYVGIAISLVGLIFWGAVFGIGLRFMYEIFQQIEADTAGQLTQIVTLLQAVV